MRICEETLDNFSISYPLDRLAPLERILFLDIETTGFTAKSSYLYLIGCAYCRAGKWQTIQWMGGKLRPGGRNTESLFPVCTALPLPDSF